MSDFDAVATNYDHEFTQSCIGIAQREQVWNYIDQLNLKPSTMVLEINCGTGEDAFRWKEKGHEIIATDLSAGMIEMAQQAHPSIDFQQLDLRNLNGISEPISLIFSNFGGLNCISPAAFESFFKTAYHRLPESGQLVLVIMGKKCLWDRGFLTLKGRWSEIRRRNSTDAIAVNVAGSDVQTWYYSPKQVRKFSKKFFKIQELKPVGFFVPPSYLAPFFSKNKRLLALFKWLDRCLPFPFLSNYADHYLVYLTKKTTLVL